MAYVVCCKWHDAQGSTISHNQPPWANQQSKRRPMPFPTGRRRERYIISNDTGEDVVPLDMSRVADAVPKLQAGSSYGDTAIELLGDVVIWSLFLWFGRPRGGKTCVCDCLVMF